MSAEAPTSNGRNANHDVIKRLSVFLRQHGDRVLSGQSKLSLTANSLLVLNEGFALLSSEDFTTSFEVLPANSTRIPAYQDLQFLYDLVQKTVALKLIHGSGTLQGRVNIAAFRSLRILEIKKTPLHLVEGIQKTRDKLHTVTCTRCITNLQEIFESCGGDLTAPMSWPELLNLDLSYNAIEELDSSLRLVPRLERINLSHNMITDTENYLEYLTELSVLNLGYNLLRAVPSLAVSVKSRLQHLVLRNNDLDHIQGVEELSGLKELDLCNNCLIDHQSLSPLRALQRLHSLQVDGNPLSYHKEHRKLTMERVHPMAARMLVLDKKTVTDQELKHCRQTTNAPSLHSTSSTQQLIINDPSSVFEQSLDYTSANTTHEDTDFRFTPISTSSGGRSRGRRLKAKVKAKRPEISDPGVEDSSDFEPPPPAFKIADTSSTPVSDHHIHMKQELETLRNQLGPDWLQSVATQKKLANQNALNFRATNGNSRRNSSPKLPTNGSAEPSAVDKTLQRQNHRQEKNLEPKIIITNPSEQKQISHKNDAQPLSAQEREKATTDQSDYDPDLNPFEQDSEGEVPEAAVEKNAVSKRNVRESTSSEIAIYVTNDEANLDEVEDTDEIDYGVESEPFIVTLTPTCEQLLVSVTEHHLLEKNLNGDFVETLELKCLKSVQVAPPGERTPELHLFFDYMKKSKKERKYAMEDENDVKAFHELLKPAVEERRRIDHLKNRFECMKCGQKFQKAEADKKYKTPPVNVQKKLFTDTKKLQETLLCPNCGSEMVVAVEIHPDENKVRGGATVVTPVGSYGAATPDVSPKKMPHSLSSPLMKRVGSTGTMDSTSASYRSCRTDLSSSFQSCSMVANQTNTANISTSLTNESPSSVPSSQNPRTANDSGFGRDVGPARSIGPSGADVFSSESCSTVHASGSVGFDTSDLTNPFLEASGSESGPSLASRDVGSKDGLPRGKKSSSDVDVGRKKHEVSDRNSRVSVDSDIIVLKNPSRTCSQSDSDVIVLGPGESSRISTESDICILQEQEEQPLDAETVPTVPSEGFNVTSEETLRDSQSFNEQTLVSGPTEPCDTVSNPRGDYLSVEDAVSPCGSLSEKTVHSMVDSVYENHSRDSGSRSPSVSGATRDNSPFRPSILFTVGSEETRKSPLPSPFVSSVDFIVGSVDSNSGSSRNSYQNSPVGSAAVAGSNAVTNTKPKVNADAGAEAGVVEENGIRYNYEDFKVVDHRLKLHLMMNLFKDSEEFSLVLKPSGIVHYPKKAEFKGLIVLSDTKLYVLKSTGDNCEDLSRCYKLKSQHALTELKYVDIGLSYQNLRLEFGGDTGCYIIMIRDQKRGRKFVRQFTSQVQKVSLTSRSQLEAISKNPDVLQNLERQVLNLATGGSHQEGAANGTEPDSALLKFVMCYLKSGEIGSDGEAVLCPVSIALTTSHISMATENYCLPPPRTATGGSTKGSPKTSNQQFTLKDQQKITDITSMDLESVSPTTLALNFCIEDTNEECAWSVVMETKDGLQLLVEKIKELWEAEFGVDMQINQT